MTLPPAELWVEQDGPVVVARVRGDIDMSNARDLREQLSARTPNDALGLVLDLSEVDYLDSAGIHLIHHLGRNLRAGGQELILVIPDDSPIQATLRLAGLDWSGQTVSTAEAGRDRLRPNGDHAASGAAPRG